MEGVPDAERHEERVRKVVGDQIEGMTATVVVPAMLSFRHGDSWVTRQVQLIGIDETTQSSVSDFGKYLQHPENRRATTSDLFKLREGGYDVRDHNGGTDAPERKQMRMTGWPYRRAMAPFQFEQRAARTDPITPAAGAPVDPFAAHERKEGRVFDPAKEQHTGVILGIAMSSYRDSDGEDHFLVLPGDDVQAEHSHRRRPAQSRQRQLHHRRFLREQDERVRRHLRLRADPQAARVAGHDRPDLGGRDDQLHRHQAQAGRRRQRRPRQAPRRLPPGYVRRLDLARQASSRCWPPCKWRPPSSTCCCS